MRYAVNIYIYTDESGTFDCLQGKFFVYGGLLFLDEESRETCSRKYSAVEHAVRDECAFSDEIELKACALSFAERQRLFRVTNKEYRFGVVVRIQNLRIREKIAYDKKEKQRYLDYAFKITIKRFFEYLIRKGTIVPDDIANIHFYIDQHTTATNGRYELEESLKKEFLFGTNNFSYDCHFAPLFTKAKSVKVTYCDSKHITLIRAADIIANRIYYKARHEMLDYSPSDNFHIITLP